MMNSHHGPRSILAFAIAFAAMLTGNARLTGEAISYSRDVRPILSDNCYACHGPDASTVKAGLQLHAFEPATSKLQSGNLAIVPGDADASELIKRIEHADVAERMPPKATHKTLTAEQKQTLRAWIESGATYEKHWAFETPLRPNVPRVKQRDWPRNVIDSFVLARLEAEGLSPSPEADRATLARRLHFDLLGLPPTPEKVQQFVNDKSPDAYEKLIDRLLASEHFGERMALPWLDAARYADTNGFSIDDHRDVWLWRDWVIDAYNSNMPYDQFIIEQIAGDLLPEAPVDQKVATGFLRNSMSTHEGGTLPQEYRVIYLADKVDTVSTVFMGLTIKCAQCHEHKFDPITQKEYYKLYAYFDRAIEHGMGKAKKNLPPEVFIAPKPEREEALREQLERRVALLKEWKARLEDKANHDDPMIGRMFDPLFVRNNIAARTVGTEITVLEKVLKENKASTMVMQEQATPPTTYVLIRGAYDAPDKDNPVEPGTPAALPPLPKDAPPNRLGLAQWLVSPNHPLTARVAVNRYWQTLFGRGIVSPGYDFGYQGQPPSHQQLIDWLATEFIKSGWDRKHIIKQIVMSATYRQASAVSPELLKRDPDNRLLARGPRYRLPAEFVRDNALAVAGVLNDTVGGPSVYPMQPPGLWREVSHYGYPGAFTSQVFVPDRGEDLRRRSIYTFWKRTSPPPAMSAFDAPTREVCTVERSKTNTPLQALVLLNDPQFMDAARALAAMTIEKGGDDDRARLQFAFQQAVQRDPSMDEISILLNRLKQSRAKFKRDTAAAVQLIEPTSLEPIEGLDPAEHAAWTVVAGVILNLDETISKE